MSKKNYSDQLKHPNWQKKRLEVLNRDEFTCQLCDDKETTLHVHHKTYSPGKQPWEYELTNFKTLCEVCHTVEGSNNTPDELEFIKVIKIKKSDGASHLYSVVKDLKYKRFGIELGEYVNGEYVFKHYFIESTLELLTLVLNKYKSDFL